MVQLHVNPEPGSVVKKKKKCGYSPLQLSSLNDPVLSCTTSRDNKYGIIIVSIIRLSPQVHASVGIHIENQHF